MTDETLTALLGKMKWGYAMEKTNALPRRPDESWERVVTESWRDSMAEYREALRQRGHGDNPWVMEDVDDVIYILERLVRLGEGASDAPPPRDAQAMALALKVLMER